MDENFSEPAGLDEGSSTRRRFLTLAAAVPAVTGLGVGTAAAASPSLARRPGRGSRWSGWSLVDGGSVAVIDSPTVVNYLGAQWLLSRGQENDVPIDVLYNGTWGGWADASSGGSTGSAPDAVVYNNKIYLFVQAPNQNIIYQKTFFSGVWSEPSAVPDGLTPSAPASAVYNSSLWVIVRGTDNAIYQNFVFQSGRHWAGWQEIPGKGSTYSAPSAVTYQNNLYVFARGTDDAIYQNILDDGSWSGWAAVPGSGLTLAAPCSVVHQNKLYLLVQGTDNGIYWNRLSHGSWSGWNSVPGGGMTRSAPAAAPLGRNLNVYARGLDDRLYLNTFTP